MRPNQLRPDWSLEEIRILKELYPENNTEDLTLFLNRSVSAIAHKAHRLKLGKSDKFLASFKSGRFQPKTTFWNRIKNLLKKVG